MLILNYLTFQEKNHAGMIREWRENNLVSNQFEVLMSPSKTPRTARGRKLEYMNHQSDKILHFLYSYQLFLYFVCRNAKESSIKEHCISFILKLVSISNCYMSCFCSKLLCCSSLVVNTNQIHWGNALLAMKVLKHCQNQSIAYTEILDLAYCLFFKSPPQ